MRVAVIGGGIFGCTTAIFAKRAGHEVHLFELNSVLLRGASWVNQFRLHEGYHYPRAPETVAECKAGNKSFREEYGNAVIDTGKHYYAIAMEGSRITGADYLRFCDANSLPLSLDRHGGFLNIDEIDVSISVSEGRINPYVLVDTIRSRLFGVNVHRSTPASISLRDRFDKIVIASYASTNEVAIQLECAIEPFQYEVIEKPIVRMPQEFSDVGIVIMDGEFCSLDPWGSPGLHVMGHVKHAIHHRNVGLSPHIPPHINGLLDGRVWIRPGITKFAKFIESGKRYIPALEHAKHRGSMFTIRAVLPDVDD